MNIVNKRMSLLLLVLMPVVSVKAQESEIPKTRVSFEKIQLLDEYITEGASIGDINGDGHPDIIAGTVWWEGPDFEISHTYAPMKTFPITTYAANFFTFPDHFDGDRWLDILEVGQVGSTSRLIKNPGKKSSGSYTEATFVDAQEHVCNEAPQLVDVIGDEKKELLAFSDGRIILGIPGRDKENSWKTLHVSHQDHDRFAHFSHGLGAGDINNDGLTDILEKNGWWEQPKDWDQKTPWKFHSYPFSPEQGGAQMFAYDVDGDGDNDVVTSMNGHGYGLSWHEQITNEEGEIDFIEHKIMTDSPAGNKYGVVFSQLHAVDMADIDNDGILDIVTGKAYYAHNGNDPGAEDPAVLYWFKTTRNADGSVEFVPHLIDDNSGVGRQISTGDLNNDGKIDIVVGNKKGVFAFIQK